jgi:phosphoserine phosphatase
MVKKKAELLAIADKEGIHINQTIAVGDGANDCQCNLAGLELLFMLNLRKRKAESSISAWVWTVFCIFWATMTGI